jgi:hypothetical protein
VRQKQVPQTGGPRPGLEFFNQLERLPGVALSAQFIELSVISGLVGVNVRASRSWVLAEASANMAALFGVLTLELNGLE